MVHLSALLKSGIVYKIGYMKNQRSYIVPLTIILIAVAGISGGTYLYSKYKEKAAMNTILYVDSKKVDCFTIIGVDVRGKCLNTKTNPKSAWEPFPEVIEGFNFEEGYQYKLSVTVTKIENPPMDSSGREWRLNRIIEKNKD